MSCPSSTVKKGHILHPLPWFLFSPRELRVPSHTGRQSVEPAFSNAHLSGNTLADTPRNRLNLGSHGHLTQDEPPQPGRVHTCVPL